MSEDRQHSLLCKFYAAGYDNRKFPRPLNHVPVAVRAPLRRAYRDGEQQRNSEERLYRALRGRIVGENAA